MINKKLYFTLMLLFITLLVPYAGAMDNAIPASSTTTTTIPLPTTTALLANAALAQTSALLALATAEIITMRSSTEFEIALKAAIDSVKPSNVTVPSAPALLSNNNDYSWNDRKGCLTTSNRAEIRNIMYRAEIQTHDAKRNDRGELECPYPGCTKAYKSNKSPTAFKGSDGLRNHIASHHLGIKFQCECGSILLITTALYAHNATCAYQIKPKFPHLVPQEEAPLQNVQLNKKEEASHVLVTSAPVTNSDPVTNSYYDAKRKCFITRDRAEVKNIMDQALTEASDAQKNYLNERKCPYSNCNKTDNQINRLRNHIANHHSGKKFLCKCGSIMDIVHAHFKHKACTSKSNSNFSNPVPQEEAPLEEEETPHVKEKKEQAAHALVNMLLSASHNGGGKRHPASTRRRGSSSSRMNQKTNSTTHDTASNDKDSEIQEPPRKKVRFRGDWSGILSQVAPSTTAINNTSSSSNTSSASTPWRPSTYADRTEAARKAYEQHQLVSDAYDSGLLPLSPSSSSSSSSSSSASRSDNGNDHLMPE